MRAIVFVLLASLLFGTTGTAKVLGAPGVDVVSLGAARVVIGGAILAVLAMLLSRRARRGSALEHVGPRRRLSSSSAVVVGGLGVVAYQPAFFLGTERNGVAVGTLVALGSAPLLTGAVTWVLSRRFPGARWAIATGVAIVGLILLGGAGGSVRSGGGIDALGLAGSLGAGLAYAVYTLASKRLLDNGWSGPSTMGAVFGAAAVIGTPVLLLTDLSWLATVPGALTAGWLGVATVAAAYLLFAAGLRALSAPTVSTLTLAEPLTATLLGVLVLGERLSVGAWWGLAAIAAGILILIVRRRAVSDGGITTEVVLGDAAVDPVAAARTSADGRGGGAKP